MGKSLLVAIIKHLQEWWVIHFLFRIFRDLINAHGGKVFYPVSCSSCLGITGNDGQVFVVFQCGLHLLLKGLGHTVDIVKGVGKMPKLHPGFRGLYPVFVSGKPVKDRRIYFIVLGKVDKSQKVGC